MLPALQKDTSFITIKQHQQSDAISVSRFAVNHYALSIAAKLCSVDGDVTLAEKRAFLKLFPFFNQDHLPLLQESINQNNSVYFACKRFVKFTGNNKKTSAKLFAKLFKLAVFDQPLNISEISFLEKTAKMLDLPNSYLENALEYYFLPESHLTKKYLSRADFQKDANAFHPDKFAAADCLRSRTKTKLLSLANERVRAMNESYRGV